MRRPQRRGRAVPVAVLLTMSAGVSALVAGCATPSVTAAPRTISSVATAQTPHAAATQPPATPAADPTPALAPPTSTSVEAADATGLVAATGEVSLGGKVIVVDPGHNGANGRHPKEIGRQVAIGNDDKACDTTGTETNAGYTESAFTYDVASRLAAILRSQGATVVLTRPNDRGVGPCITQRAAIGNRARADAAISIHGDGATASGYGFHVIVPKGIGRNDAIVAPSRRLGATVRDAFRAGTGEPLSTYTGTTTGGLVARNDLGGLNLSTVPKVFIECGNMRNPTDARRMTSAAWRQQAAEALAAGLTTYLTGS